jgi:hypothetical protein
MAVGQIIVRRCYKCGERKPLSSFFKNSANKSGVSSSCKECDKKNNHNHYIGCKGAVQKTTRKYYLNNRGVVLKKSRKYRTDWRIKVIGHLGGKCVICGFSDIRALQIDHVSGGGRVDRKGLTTGFYKKVVEDKSGKYQLLCANCNAIKRIINHEFKKGTINYES